jgi:hypothetical protein
MQLRSGPGERFRASRQVEVIVGVTAVEAAAPGRDQPVSPEPVTFAGKPDRGASYRIQR